MPLMNKGVWGGGSFYFFVKSDKTWIMSGKQTLGREENKFEDQCKSPGLHTVFMLTILGMF